MQQPELSSENDGWGERGKPSIADAVNMIARAQNVGDASGFLHFLSSELEESAHAKFALLAATTARPANGLAEVVTALEDFGFPDDEEDESPEDGISSDTCATLGCVVLFLATRSHSTAQALEVEPLKQAAYEANALGTLVGLLDCLLYTSPSPRDS